MCACSEPEEPSASEPAGETKEVYRIVKGALSKVTLRYNGRQYVNVGDTSGHHLIENMDKQQQEEKRKIEEKIFLKDTSKLGRKVTCTETKPFRLSNGVGSAQKREALRRRILEEEQAQCTFHPVTNESKNREIIQRILMAEDSFHSAEQGRD